MRKLGFISICMVVFLLAGSVALAQGDDHDIGRSVISTGGRERHSDDYMIIDVIGQPTSGRCENGLTLVSGFLTPVKDDYNGMMPVGGDVSPVSRLAVIAPWLVLAALIILAMTVTVWTMRKRLAQSLSQRITSD